MGDNINGEKLKGRPRNTIGYMKSIGLHKDFVENLYDKYDNNEGYRHPLD